MSFEECDGQVVLTMSREDYEQLLFVFGARVAWGLMQPFREDAGRTAEIQRLLNRLNEGNPAWQPYEVNSGNPNYRPYQIEAKK